MAITVRYFAWVREKVGREQEIVEPPATVATVADLIGWLKTRGPEYEAAFERAAFIRAAIDQAHAPVSSQLAGAREVAFFPPVTGG